MRDRLIVKIDNFCKEELGTNFNKVFLGKFADYLLENGVIVPPCKVGDVVWLIGDMRLYTKEEICSRKVTSAQMLRTGELIMHFKDGCFPSDAIGVFVFLTREEAEKALKEGEQE